MKIFTGRKKVNKTLSILVLIAFASLLLFFSNAEDLDGGSSSKILVCLDPGHGGGDSGAVGPTGLSEKNINLDIALKVKSRLEDRGYEVILTRYDDSYISDKERVEMANKRQANIFVSIHNNDPGLKNSIGTETYFSPNSSTTSKSLANYIQDKLVLALDSKNPGVKEAGFYVLKETRMPSVLVQGSFVSNWDGEEKIATGITDGIINFVSDFDISSFKAGIDDRGNTPDFILPGESVTVNIRITNMSRFFTWPAFGNNAVSISYNIFDSSGERIVFDGSRTAIKNAVTPGNAITVPLNIKMPGSEGKYTIEYDIIQEGIAWFSSRGNPTFKKNIIVTSTADEWAGTLYEESTDETSVETGPSITDVVEEDPGPDTDLEDSSGSEEQQDETGESLLDVTGKYPNKKIVFISNRDGGDYDLFVSNLDGSDLTQLTRNDVDDIYPSVSPDGTRIAYTGTINGLWQIMIMNRDGSGLYQVTKSSTLNAYPAWSNDGKYIFYESKVEGVWEIYRINTDGTGSARLTYNPSGDDWHPACHPFEPLVIFESGKPGKENIMVMDYNGENMRKITDDSARNRTPDLSGTNELITFTRYNDGDGQVFIMDINGNGLRRITAMGGRNIHSTLSPDNEYIAFDSSGSGVKQLYIFSFEDGVIRKVIDDNDHIYGDPFFLFY